ncbi:MAG: transcriptional regulator [Myxococcaceae bacterium]|nr:transcriptional regulator [Myxococcaceae bacterium]
MAETNAPTAAPAAPVPNIKLAVGDRVVYPNQGLCKVTGIDTKEVAGQKLTMVSLVREEDGAKVMVPEAKVGPIGVRKVSSGPEVEKVLEFIKSDSDKASLDWKARARTNVERMATGGLLGLAEVVKGLQVLSELRPLPTKERELYNDARHLLVAEISASMNILECDAEDTVDALLFPVGKERPKRTAEEFRALAGGDDDELGLDGDLMGGIDGEDGAAEEEPAEAEAEEGAEGEEGEAKPAAAKKEKKAKPVSREAPTQPQDALKKSVISDVDVTMPQASPISSEPIKRKRGRPPKPKPEGPPPEPKKRGRPPKPKPEGPPPEPKKRGRPPKVPK